MQATQFDDTVLTNRLCEAHRLSTDKKPRGALAALLPACDDIVGWHQPWPDCYAETTEALRIETYEALIAIGKSDHLKECTKTWMVSHMVRSAVFTEASYER